MDKETLSNYGWIVICVLVLAVMLALATPFGKFISGAIENTTTALFQTSKAGLGSAGIDAGELVFGKQDGDAENPDVSDKLIPDGGIYKKADGTTLEGNGTNEFPETPATGDTYEYEDYIYTYNKGQASFSEDYGIEWSVVVKDTSKSSYGTILSEIAGKPVTHMTRTFQKCSSLTTSPVIPDTVTNMMNTFKNCASLESAPVIPSGVTYMWNTFMNCNSLETAPRIPSNVTNMAGTFNGCSSLTTAPAIPSGVTNMNSTFSGCVILAGTIEVNANPESCVSCLSGTQITGITGSCSQATKDALMATK